MPLNPFKLQECEKHTIKTVGSFLRIHDRGCQQWKNKEHNIMWNALCYGCGIANGILSRRVLLGHNSHLTIQFKLSLPRQQKAFSKISHNSEKKSITWMICWPFMCSYKKNSKLKFDIILHNSFVSN